jgi:hypothetical protein
MPDGRNGTARQQCNWSTGLTATRLLPADTSLILDYFSSRQPNKHVFVSAGDRHSSTGCPLATTSPIRYSRACPFCDTNDCKMMCHETKLSCRSRTDSSAAVAQFHLALLLPYQVIVEEGGAGTPGWLRGGGGGGHGREGSLGRGGKAGQAAAAAARGGAGMQISEPLNAVEPTRILSAACIWPLVSSPYVVHNSPIYGYSPLPYTGTGYHET